MVKHTTTICLSVIDHFVGLAHKGLISGVVSLENRSLCRKDYLNPCFLLQSSVNNFVLVSMALFSLMFSQNM